MYNDTYNGPLFDWPSYDEVHESPDAVEHIRKCYAGLLTMTDHWVGKICDKLESLDLWDDTLVIFTTDHGTMLAEHAYWMKNIMPLYNEIVRIPLIMSLPGDVMAGTRSEALTQTIDLMPTILDYFGCSPPPHVQGQSIFHILDGQNTRQDLIFGYFGMALNITDGRFVYMRNPVNADAGPLFAYTAMPTGGLKQWYPREVYDRVEMGRYFSHTYNLPMYKIPTTGKVPRHHPDEKSYAGRNQIFDIRDDPEQIHPISDTKMEADLADRMRNHLAASEAQTEQYTRLGL